jgi:enoyl-[acyl-carrier-protein] reductase (NADH)
MINSQDNLDLNEIKFLSPMKLVEKIDEIIKEKGELYFYKENEWSETYWNIVFYFQLFDLPTCVLYVQNNMDKFEKLKNILKENKKRKLEKEKEKEKEKKSKMNFLFHKLNLGNKNKETENISDLSTEYSKYNFSNTNISDFSFLSIDKK